MEQRKTGSQITLKISSTKTTTAKPHCVNLLGLSTWKMNRLQLLMTDHMREGHLLYHQEYYHHRLTQEELVLKSIQGLINSLKLLQAQIRDSELNLKSTIQLRMSSETRIIHSKVQDVRCYLQ